MPDATFAWTAPPRHSGHPFYIRVNGDGREYVAITLRVDPDIVPADAVVRALKVIAHGAALAVADADATLASLGDATLPPALFPPEIPPAG